MRKVPIDIVGPAETNDHEHDEPIIVEMPRIGECVAVHADFSSIIDERRNGAGTVGFQLCKAQLSSRGICLYVMLTPDQADEFAANLGRTAAKIRAEAFAAATDALRKAARK